MSGKLARACAERPPDDGSLSSDVESTKILRELAPHPVAPRCVLSHKTSANSHCARLLIASVERGQVQHFTNGYPFRKLWQSIGDIGRH